jgi:hypothetical protein
MFVGGVEGDLIGYLRHPKGDPSESSTRLGSLARKEHSDGIAKNERKPSGSRISQAKKKNSPQGLFFFLVTLNQPKSNLINPFNIPFLFLYPNYIAFFLK